MTHKKGWFSRGNVSIDDFKEDITYQITSTFGAGDNKALNLVVTPVKGILWFEVIDHKKVIGKLPNLEAAIDLYNNI